MEETPGSKRRMAGRMGEHLMVDCERWKASIMEHLLREKTIYFGLGEITRTHAHSPRILRAFSARAENARRMRGEYAENTRRMRGEYASALRVLMYAIFR